MYKITFLDICYILLKKKMNTYKIYTTQKYIISFYYN